MKTRLYVVTIHEGACVLQQRLIEAPHRAAAIRWAARDFIDATTATPYDAARIIGEGGRIEVAREPDTAELPLEGGA